MSSVSSPKQVAASLTELWSPRVLAEVDDAYIKVAKVHGSLAWHSHENEDELFLVLKGQLRIEMEGGSIEVNGAGCVLTTEQCLLNPNRNPHLSKSEIEQYLKNYLGIEKVLWLGEGIVGDDTDGHIDDVARFVAPEVIVCAVEDDSEDANYKLLQDNLHRLRTMTDVKGSPFQIVTLPMPGVVGGTSTHARGLDRLPASYANFYIANKVVLVPIFGQANDARALETLQLIFPDRRVMGINCEPLVWGMGTIHCITQQQPQTRS